MRKFMTLFSLGGCLLMTGASAQPPPAAQPDKAMKAQPEGTSSTAAAAPSAQTPSAQPPTNVCFLWKGRGGAPTASYMATHASCRPWNSNSGWSFFKKNNGVDYYRGTFKDKDAVVTPSTWAVYADFGSAAVSSKADYDAFVANTKLSGSCGECLR